jgi:hypothetical protein
MLDYMSSTVHLAALTLEDRALYNKRQTFTLWPTWHMSRMVAG